MKNFVGLVLSGPAVRAYSAPPVLVAELRGPLYSKGERRGRKEREGGKGWKWTEERRKKGRAIPRREILATALVASLLSPPLVLFYRCLSVC